MNPHLTEIIDAITLKRAKVSWSHRDINNINQLLHQPGRLADEALKLIWKRK
jgi:hypothetical protein